jgi:hypothetical protein
VQVSSGNDLRDHRPKGACWLNLHELVADLPAPGALAGQEFADPDEIAHATRVATA